MATSAHKSATKRKKKPTTQHKTVARKKKKSSVTGAYEYTANLIGLILALLAVFAIGKFGVVGKLLANGTRFLVGNSYQILLVVLLIPLIVVVAYGQWPRNFKPRYYVGFALAYLGIILGMSIRLFNHLNLHHDYLSAINGFIQQDMMNGSVSTPVGGGMIGAFIYSGTYTTISNIGSWIIAVLLVIGGFIVAFKLDVREIFKIFFDLTAATGKTIETGVQTGVEKSVALAEGSKEKAYRFAEERRNKHYDDIMNQDDPFATDTIPRAPKYAPTKKPEPEDDQMVEPSITKQDDMVTAEMDPVESYKRPTIIAPEPLPTESLATDDGVAEEAEVESLAAESLSALVGSDKPKQTMTVPPVNALSSLPFDDEVYMPADSYKETVPMEDSSETLTHADVLGHNEAQTSAKTTAHQDNVGHVEPSTQSEPVADLAMSAMPVIDDANYILPTTKLLTHMGSTDQSKERAGLEEKARILHETLKSFNINATVEKVVLGPTVTQYEIKPAVGVKVSKITNLADDLALALAAKSLRIEAPIPGKSLVGIEVANETQAMVGFRDMMDSVGINRQKPIEVPIGKSVSGDIIKMDLAKMPHLLIAGSTGSGKSVAINSILASILLQAKPSEVRLMMVDPKKVELSVYNDIPHLITPVVSEPRKAALALKKVVAEMDRRFKLLTEYGAKKIDNYNHLVEKHNAEGDGSVWQKMPYLVVVIDELADLMMTAAGEVEPAIVRITQLGRAAGIHMIVATQRPSVDIITGLIKANVPSRMAFAVSSGIDSRTILDGNGAEKLLGRGDMLYSPIGANSPQRVQGAFLTDEDVEALTDFIKQQGDAQYDETMTVSDSEVSELDKGDDSGNTGGNHANDLDELWSDVIDFVIDQQRASTSLVQRRFRIGYNRAARLIDDLEDHGIIGPQDGSKPRKVLLTKEVWDRQKQVHAGE